MLLINLEKIMKMITFKKAFTLAEVLITLGIIGIVAAMTIPVMISNSKKEATAPATLPLPFRFLNETAGNQKLETSNRTPIS